MLLLFNWPAREWGLVLLEDLGRVHRVLEGGGEQLDGDLAYHGGHAASKGRANVCCRVHIRRHTVRVVAVRKVLVLALERELQVLVGIHLF